MGLSGSLLLRVLKFEFMVVECIYRYFPKRWAQFGSTLLFIPNAASMTLPEIQNHFKERYQIVGRLPEGRLPREVSQTALMANLPPGPRERAATLFESMDVFEVLERLVQEYYEEQAIRSPPNKKTLTDRNVFSPGAPVPRYQSNIPLGGSQNKKQLALAMHTHDSSDWYASPHH